jgi:hypothetical protein
MMGDFPLPWCVGPYGDIWVAADVEVREGKWHATCAEPRIVVTMAAKNRDLAEFIVHSANAQMSPPPPPY